MYGTASGFIAKHKLVRFISSQISDYSETIGNTHTPLESKIIVQDILHIFMAEYTQVFIFLQFIYGEREKKQK